MDSPLSLFCPRCPDSTTAYSLDELREHVAQSGFVYPSMALYHFRFVCCLQGYFLTTAFTKNMLSMGISFFYQLYLIETEAIRNLQSSDSTPTPVPSPFVSVEEEPLVFAAEDQNNVNHFLKKLQTEIEGKNSAIRLLGPPTVQLGPSVTRLHKIPTN